MPVHGTQIQPRRLTGRVFLGRESFLVHASVPPSAETPPFPHAPMLVTSTPCLKPIPKRLGFCYSTGMPTVLRFGGLRVIIYPADHRPAHVHVIAAGSEAVFILDCPDGPPKLRESYGFGRPEIGRIEVTLGGKIAALCEEWRKIHGGD